MRGTRAVISSNLNPSYFLKCNLEAILLNFIPIIISSHTVYYTVCNVLFPNWHHIKISS